MPGTEIHQVEYVDTVSNRIDASALSRIEAENDIYAVNVPSGMTRQRLTFSGNDADHYQVFLGITSSSAFAGKKPGTAAFDAAVKEWAGAWNIFAERKKLKRRQIQFHFIDEPRSPVDFATLKKWLVPFREANDMIAIYNNPVQLEKAGNFEAAREALALCDVICPMTREYVNYKPEIRNYFEELKALGKDIYFYSCDGPSWFYHPAYWRDRVPAVRRCPIPLPCMKTARR